MRGIILAGGSGTRLAPLTNIISKQLLPVYDKPMICYPLASLMNMGIKDILIISTPHDTPHIENFLGDGSDYGINLSYAVQDEPKGIAEAFIIGADFIGDDNVCLILGDNIFYGAEVNLLNLQEKIDLLNSKEVGGLVFSYHVSDPERYGVIEFDQNDEHKVVSLEEKPTQPKSNWVATGIYMYNNDVIQIAKSIQPSHRGELEITDVNKIYLENSKLGVIRLRRGFAWLDAGTTESLLDAAQFIHTVEKRQGLKIACLEEIAFRKNFIDKKKFRKLLSKYKQQSSYRKYLDQIIDLSH